MQFWLPWWKNFWKPDKFPPKIMLKVFFSKKIVPMKSIMQTRRLEFLQPCGNFCTKLLKKTKTHCLKVETKIPIIVPANCHQCQKNVRQCPDMMGEFLTKCSSLHVQCKFWQPCEKSFAKTSEIFSKSLRKKL